MRQGTGEAGWVGAGDGAFQVEGEPVRETAELEEAAAQGAYPQPSSSAPRLSPGNGQRGVCGGAEKNCAARGTFLRCLPVPALF